MTKQALHKIEKFVKVALAEIEELKTELQSFQVKQAEAVRNDKETEKALRKAAQALYDSDFINDEEEKTLFVKKSQEDIKYLAKVVERVCTAADVAYMGKVASVKSAPQSDDPVMRRAFGNQGYDLLLDD